MGGWVVGGEVRTLVIFGLYRPGSLTTHLTLYLDAHNILIVIFLTLQ